MRVVGRDVGKDVSLFCGGLLALALSGVMAFGQALVTPRLPAGVAYDTAGNLYFADVNRHQVFEASLGGALVVVAGSGVQGFAGDGAAAVNAQLDSPQGVAVGLDGTIYIADTGNQRIRAVIAGKISTFAGSGAKGFSGDGGAAVGAAFRGPVALALDLTGAMLVCDSGNQRVRRISGGTVSTIAGSGVQGFSGDGGPAVAAAFDTLSGIAVGADGRIFVADSHNQRIRVIAPNGTVSTFAGTGVSGYAGDGGPATAALLSLPRGVVVANGDVIFADANNQRIRSVDASGTISTIAGDGVQGVVSNSPVGAAAATTVLNSPRGVALSAFASPVFADSANRMVRVLLSNANLYLPAALTTGRTSTVTLTAPSNGIYGQGSATVNVSGSAGVPQGVVQLLDNGTAVGTATLSGGVATIPLSSLPAGTHALSAAYAGDGVNPAGVSASSSITVTAATVTASANALSLAYGLAIPPLSGTISGVLAQDTGSVTALFSTPAVYLSPTGTYPIHAALSGPAGANYMLVLSPASGSLTIVPAPTLVVEQVPVQGYAGMPMVLNATVTPSTGGAPTGTVSFIANGTVVATGNVIGGAATATWLSPASGTPPVVATYSGDGNFIGSTSATTVSTVSAMPDFALTVPGGTSQTVQGGLIATYTITVAASPGPFTGAVSMSASGAPVGAVVSFAPALVVPGSGSVTVTMSVLTPVTKVEADHRIIWLGLAGLIVAGATRRRRIAGFLLLLGLAGCGARTLSEASAGSQSYAMSVKGTSTNLAGSVVTHSAGVTLVVE